MNKQTLIEATNYFLGEMSLPLSTAKKYTRQGKKNAENTEDLVMDAFNDLFANADKNGRYVLPFEYSGEIEQPQYIEDDNTNAVYNRLLIALRDQFPDATIDPVEDRNKKIAGTIIANGKEDTAKLFIRKQKTVGSKEVLKALTGLGDLKNSGLKKDEYVVIISRHPYDVASMSTNRQWTSCKNLHSGCNRHYVKGEVGRIAVAYLTKKVPGGVAVKAGGERDTKKIITKDIVGEPIMRVLIQPWIEKSGEYIYYFPYDPDTKRNEHKDLVYGLKNTGIKSAFMDQIEKFLLDKQGESPDIGNRSWKLPSDVYQDEGNSAGSGRSISKDYVEDEDDEDEARREEITHSISRRIASYIFNDPEAVDDATDRLIDDMHSIIDAYYDGGEDIPLDELRDMLDRQYEELDFYVETNTEAFAVLAGLDPEADDNKLIFWPVQEYWYNGLTYHFDYVRRNRLALKSFTIEEYIEHINGCRPSYVKEIIEDADKYTSFSGEDTAKSYLLWTINELIKDDFKSENSDEDRFESYQAYTKWFFDKIENDEYLIDNKFIDGIVSVIYRTFKKRAEERPNNPQQKLDI